MTNVKSLLEMYVKMGGSLTDTYSDIAGGVPVGQYSTISDAILACSKKYSAGGGGGAEKFVVTLTKANDTWTADKTAAEIVAAYDADQVVVCRVPFEDYNAHTEIPCWFAGENFASFGGLITFDNPLNVEAQIFADGNDTEVLVRTTPIPTSSNAPLIVTLTADQSTGNLVGDKTYKEVYDAVDGGQTVTFKGNNGSISFATNALSVGLANGGYSVAFVFGGAITEAEGAETDNVSFHVS